MNLTSAYKKKNIKNKSFCQEQAELKENMLKNAGNTGYYDQMPPRLIEIRRIEGIVKSVLYRDGVNVNSIALAIAHAILNIR